MTRGFLLAVALAACSGGSRPGHESLDPGGSGGGGEGSLCDGDRDGHFAVVCGGDDCDERSPVIYPGAPELCSGGIDEDCDGVIDDGCRCKPGDVRRCYPLGDDHDTRNLGACHDGSQRCDEDGSGWGRCDGAATPRDEAAGACDGVDDDCDGLPDDGVSNPCGACGELAEICGNGLDDDCDGRIDPADLCTLRCDDLDPSDLPRLECCLLASNWPGAVARTQLSFHCQEDPLLPRCSSAERRCLDLDDDPSTTCEKRCSARGCACGLHVDGGPPTSSPSCGFETACARVDCDDRQDQPCYSGNPRTLGKGICHGGTFSCVDRAWTTCEGEQLPDVEVCGDSLDNDCDGHVDEEDGATHRSPCDVRDCGRSALELCNDGEDDDCDGFVDEGCLANADEQACYAGLPGTRGIGACSDGVQRREGSYWGACLGSVAPSPERCGDGIDSDCDGFGAPGSDDDTGCCEPTGPEICDGEDDDCNGLVDEEVLSACGTCPDDPCEQGELLGPDACSTGKCDGLAWTDGALRPTRSPGRYVRVVDARHLTAEWIRLSWSGSAGVEATVTVAPTRAALDATGPCASGSTLDVSLDGCATPGNRFARLELTLRLRARVDWLRLIWTRP